jgi:hypothetical protein
MEKRKFVAPPLKKNSLAPEFAPSEQGSKPYGGLNQSNGKNLSSSQNLTIGQETLTQKRPQRTDISFSYCRDLINKPVTNSDRAKTHFHSMSGDVDDIINVFLKGYAVSPFKYTNNYKNSENATVAGLLIVDIDNQEWVEQEIIDTNEHQDNNGHQNDNKLENEKSSKPQDNNDHDNNNGHENNKIQIVKQKVYQHQLTLEEYQAIDFCRKYTFAITTVNHTEAWHRFRVFMPLPMDIDKITYGVAVRHLNAILKGAIDTNATNPSIGFYGNSNGILYQCEEFQGLDLNWLCQLEPEINQIKAQQQKRRAKTSQKNR